MTLNARRASIIQLMIVVLLNHRNFLRGPGHLGREQKKKRGEDLSLEKSEQMSGINNPNSTYADQRRCRSRDMEPPDERSGRSTTLP